MGRIQTEETKARIKEKIQQWHANRSEEEKRQAIQKYQESRARNFEPKAKAICPVCKNEFIGIKYCSRECYWKVSYHEGVGWGKSGWYKGYWCDSSYELAWVVYQLEYDIAFERNYDRFPYVDENGQNREYIPDFKVKDIYIEIKGFVNDRFQYKVKHFQKPLIILYYDSLEPILEHVITKYGSNFIDLYDGKPYEYKKENKCKLCGKPAYIIYCSRICVGKNPKSEETRKRISESLKIGGSPNR